MNTVSVIMPTFNHARYLRAAIDSALAQTHPPHEVIVVDDGSTDATPAILSEYGDRIRAMRQPNAGVAAARNAGLATASGDYVAFLDSDDVWAPDKLERQLALFAANPALGLVHCGVERMDANGSRLSVSLDGLDGWVAEEMLRLDRDVFSGPGSCTMVPKRIADEAGGFDPRLPVSEDWDFCYRVAARYPVGYVRAPLVRYRIHPAGIHLNIGRMERGMALVLEKAFASGDPAGPRPRLRRHAYGRLHRILAGCYFERREGRAFAAHALKSLRYDVRNIRYFAGYPWRIAARALSTRARATPET